MVEHLVSRRVELKAEPMVEQKAVETDTDVVVQTVVK
jgi:hypothetical protein